MTYSDLTPVCLGPDTSNVNGKALDGAAAVAQRMTFALSKVTQGTTFRDSVEVANHQQAIAHGLLAVAYHFGEPGQGAAQADFMLDTLLADGIDPSKVGIVFDCEVAFGNQGPTAADAQAFAARVKQRRPGQPVGLYTGAWYWAGHLGNPALPVEFDYLIHSLYVGPPNVGDPWAVLQSGGSDHAGVTPGYWQAFGGPAAANLPRLRQYASTVSIGGIDPCDVNVWDRGLPALTATLLGSGRPTPTPADTPPAPAGPTPTQVEALQRAVHVQADGVWGPVTDGALLSVEANHRDRAEQRAVGVPQDGIWGPISQAGYVNSVRAIQAALGVAVDGVWGPNTDNAFQQARRTHH